MNWNLFSKELSRSLLYLFIWSFIVVLLTIVAMSFYPYMSEMGESMTKIMQMMPQAFMKAMGIDPNMWSSILGLYNTYYGIYIIVLMGIYSAYNGANMLSKEERNHTAEFLLTKPITRGRIFFSKFMVTLTLLLGIFILQLISAYIGVKIFGESGVKWDIFWAMHIHGLANMFFFTCLLLILSVVLNPRMNFMGLAVGLVFGTYFLKAISQAVDKASWLGYFSPYHYLSINIYEPNYSVNYINLTIFTFLSVIMVVGAFYIYRHKDIDA